MSDPLRRKLVKYILPRVGVFGAGDGKVEQRESDTAYRQDLHVLPSGSSWWAKLVGREGTAGPRSG